MGIDPDTGYYNHQYFEKEIVEDSGSPSGAITLNILDNSNSVSKSKINNNNDQSIFGKTAVKLCVICKDVKEKHLSISAPQLANNNNINYQEYESNNNLVNNDEYRDMQRDMNAVDNINNSQNKLGSTNLISTAKQPKPIDPSYIEKLELEFKDKDLCIICYANELNEESYKLPCGHRFCRDCIKNYLVNKINESKVIDIKCLQAGCINIIPDGVIKENVNQLAFQKFIKYKKRAAYLENYRRGYVPCPSPDCEEWVSFREGMDPFVKCQFNHQFCARCQQGWHRRSPCRNVRKKYIY
jgi:hypothetical protein